MSDFDWSQPLDAAIACPLLESLSLYGTGVIEQDWSRCWSLWTRLTSLLLEDYDFHDIDGEDEAKSTFFEGLPTTRITKLELIKNYGLWDELVFLKLCPELETFTWCPRGYGRLLTHLTEQARHCPRLVNFTLNIISTEKEELQFLESRATIAPIRILSLSRHFGFGKSFCLADQSSRRLLALSIRVLDIRKTHKTDSEHVHELLCTLPGLEVLSARVLRESDTLDDPRPWICQNLTSLTVDIVPTATGSQAAIFDRISGLKFLRTLDLSCNRSLNSLHLTFRLDCELDKLATLIHLTYLTLPNASQDMTTEDIQWVLERWPQLMTFDAIYHRDPELNESLKQLLIKGGVIYGVQSSVGIICS